MGANTSLFTECQFLHDNDDDNTEDTKAIMIPPVFFKINLTKNSMEQTFEDITLIEEK